MKQRGREQKPLPHSFTWGRVREGVPVNVWMGRLGEETAYYCLNLRPRTRTHVLAMGFGYNSELETKHAGWMRN